MFKKPSNGRFNYINYNLQIFLINILDNSNFKKYSLISEYLIIHQLEKYNPIANVDMYNCVQRTRTFSTFQSLD